MNKLFYFIILLLTSITFANAQQNLGARLTAMGINGAAVKDIWNLEGNPSGITNLKSPMVAVNYSKSLFDSELSKQAIAFAIPHQNNFFGASFQRYGITAYNELKAGFALARKFGNSLSIAIKGNYHQIKINNYGATTGFSVDVGAMYEYGNNLIIGLSINNPSLQKYNSKVIETKIPTIIQTGIAYNASNKILIATTLFKDLDRPIDVGLGLEYKLLELMSIRAGITAKPFKQYVGFGLDYKKMMLDMAVESDPHLGYIPQIALAYAF